MQGSRDNSVSVQFGWYIIVSLMLLLLPVRFLICWVTAALIHELFHLAVIKMFGVSVRNISIGLGGTVIQTDAMDPPAEALSALAGPCGGLFILLLRKRWPMLALCAAVQTFFNLLPLYPFDGGRVLHCVTSGIKNENLRKSIVTGMQWITLTVMIVAGVAAFSVGLGPVPIIVAIVCFVRSGK